MLVMKFGGTSLGSSERIRNCCNLVAQEAAKQPVIVVVSAMATATDRLIDLASTQESELEKKFQAFKDLHHSALNELLLSNNLLDAELSELQTILASKDRSLPQMDKISSFGERLSAKIVAACLEQSGIEAKSFSAGDIGLITDSNFGNAEPLEQAYDLIQKNLADKPYVSVITGFIGKTGSGEITTLGRGGSDFSASIIGKAVHANEIQIWTDVDGIMTFDPKEAGKAKVIPELSFEEACELAYFGAKVIHPKALMPAMTGKVPIRILNSFNPSSPGTLIAHVFKQKAQHPRNIIGLACKKGVSSIEIRSPQFLNGNTALAKIFTLCEKYDTIIDIIFISVVSVSLLLSDTIHLDEILQELEQIGEVEVTHGKSIICIVGGQMNVTASIGAIFTALAEDKIVVEMVSHASGGVSFTFVVDDSNAKKALAVLHEKCINIILI